MMLVDKIYKLLPSSQHNSAPMKKGFFVLLLLSCIISCSHARHPIEMLTENHTRVAWIQDQGNGSDSYGFGNNFKLMGLDSRDGKGERPLLNEVGNFYKPIFTPDGKFVVVSSRTKHQTYLVDFKKKRKEILGTGVAIEVWQDPADKRLWVYALSGKGHENKYLSKNPIVRYPLDNPSSREIVWDKTAVSWSNFNISQDGKTAGGLFPWPHAGLLRLDKKKWKKYGRGCWTALSPDNRSILWIFDGLHRNLNFVDPFSGKRWITNINNAPGIEGFEVYHPRWSNRIEFLTITGPYVEGEGGNKISGGGKKVEVYIGKFNQELTKVAGWQQVTANEKADFYPDLWIAGTPGVQRAEIEQEQGAPHHISTSNEWPAAKDTAIYLWENMSAENQLADSSPIGFHQINVIPAGRARYNRHLEMALKEFGFTTDMNSSAVMEVIKQNNSFTLEFLYTPPGDIDTPKGTLFDFCSEQGCNFNVSQDGDKLSLQYRTNKQGHVDSVTLQSIFFPARSVYLSYQFTNSELQIYTNGKLAFQKEFPDKLVESWHPGNFQFGTLEKNSTQGVLGSISHVVMYPTKIDRVTTVRNAQLVTGKLESRTEIPFLLVKGKLLEATPIPSPDTLGAYSRAMVVNRYGVEAISKGNYANKEILVAQWAVLDRTILPEAKKQAIGSIETFKLELFDSHPQLEGERLLMDMFEPDLELYYAID